MRLSFLVLLLIFSTSLWAFDFGPEKLELLKAKMPAEDFFKALKISPNKNNKWPLTFHQIPCLIEIQISKKKLQQFSFSCDKAFDPKLLVSETLKWQERPSLQKGSAITGDYLIGNPEKGFLLHMNSKHQVISFHLAESWKSEGQLKNLEEIKGNKK